jgi:hypothetical protein
MIAGDSIYGKYKAAILADAAPLKNYNDAVTAKETADDKLAANVKAIEDTWAEIAA